MIRRRCIWCVCVMLLAYTCFPLVADEIEFSEEEEVDLELEDLFNVKVSVASKKEEDISGAPGVIYVVSQDEIKRAGAITLKEILMRVPSMGISMSTFTSRSLPVMRGDLVKINAGHILFLLNGRPIREVQEGGVSSDLIETFPVDAIEQVEVIRGPGSVLYGSDAFSGVVNIITRHDTDVEGVSFSGTGHYEPVTGGGGSGVVSVNLGEMKVTAAGRYYAKPEWTPTHLKALQGRVGTNPNTGRPILGMVDSVIDYVDVTDAGTGVFLDMHFRGLSLMGSLNRWTATSFQIPIKKASQEKYFVDGGYRHDINDAWNTELHASYTHTAMLTDEYAFIERQSNNMLFENTHFLSLNDRLNFVAGGTAIYIDGKEYSLNSFTGEKETPVASDGSRWAFSGYSQIDFSFLRDVKVFGGGQVNKTADVKMHIAPRVGGIWQPVESISLKLLYSEAFRLPSVNELFMNFTGTLLGNQSLNPEIVKTTDFTVSYSNDELKAGLTFFYSIQDDIIQQGPVKNSVAWQYNNQDKVFFYGTELEGQYYINKTWYVNGSLLFQKNFQEDEDGEKLWSVVPFTDVLVKAGVSYAHPRGVTLSLFDAFQGAVSEKYDGNINNSDASTNDFDHINGGPFHMLGFSSRFDLNRLLHWTGAITPSLLFKVDNIIGREIWMYDYGGQTDDVYPSIRGREFYIGVNVTM